MFMLYRVDVGVKRCGGAFGGKATRSSIAAVACALGAYATKRFEVVYVTSYIAVNITVTSNCQ